MLIGLAGKARHGKDTVADYLVAEHWFRKLRFAAPIKHGIAVMFDLPPDAIDGDRKDEIIPWLGVSSRHLQQTLGTDWGRDMIRPDLWELLLKRRAEALLNAGVSVVVSDIRFDNEADLIRGLGGAVVHVEASPEVLAKIRNSASVDHSAHRSEAGVSARSGDRFIRNDGAIEDLQAKAERVFQEIQRES